MVKFNSKGVVPLILLEGKEKYNEIGTAARVLKVAKSRRFGVSTYILLLEGLCRIHLERISESLPYNQWEVKQLDLLPADSEEEPDELASLVTEFRSASGRLLEAFESRFPIIANFKSLLEKTPTPLLCDVFVSVIGVDFSELLSVLNATGLVDRFRLVLKIISRHTLALNSALQAAERSVGQKRPQASRSRAHSPDADAATNDDDDDDESSYNALKRRMSDVALSPEALRAVSRELRKIKSMESERGGLGPEYQKAVTYVEWMLDLPWGKHTQSARLPDIALARKNLDDDHFGLDAVKKRIVEFIAVRWSNPDARGSILCLVGPPGVGKTSLGRSIASTLGRDFHRIALGGVRDEADIRGFHRTYVGSQPGRIMQGLRRVSTADPVFLLDEIDKVAAGNSAHGDPSSALLEVLDPAQNNSFVDHYIGVPFDLSRVLFIATANSLRTIPAALLDRLEIIEVRCRLCS
jgi:ATP-dependent Lon protease